jgi:dimethylargininase
MLVALTRAVPPSMAACELTHLARQPIDVEVATAQHARYEAALRSLAVRVERVEAAPDHPDSVFIEDTAVVFDEIAVLTRPGAASRRAEVDAVAAALGRFRPIHTIAAPGTLDGGDVLIAGRRVFVGVSGRTNDAAVSQLRGVLEPLGYTVDAVPVGECLHLKSAVTAASETLLVINPDLIDISRFGRLELLEVHPAEPAAANVLCVGETIVCPDGAPRTRARLEARGLKTLGVGASELAKAEGALTCCSLLFEEQAVIR